MWDTAPCERPQYPRLPKNRLVTVWPRLQGGTAEHKAALATPESHNQILCATGQPLEAGKLTSFEPACIHPGTQLAGAPGNRCVEYRFHARHHITDLNFSRAAACAVGRW